ncbi:hypothetical protein [uncultured Thiodictyon sp.]|uniref:hypothetical protein n=1 Tax=uncultured Thiodictyon sp. TaxID=1846217 RepID=UPI0025D423A7|nr:hypothetical protein [uncultured Thiodictyon sp.]
MATNFEYWKSEIADMPQQHEDGTWYDLETGLRYDPKCNYQTGRPAPAGRAKISSHPDASMTLAALRARCERLVTSQKIAIERTTDVAAIAAARAVVAEGEQLLARRATKAELIAQAEANSAASRLMNAARRT